MSSGRRAISSSGGRIPVAQGEHAQRDPGRAPVEGIDEHRRHQWQQSQADALDCAEPCQCQGTPAYEPVADRCGGAQFQWRREHGPARHVDRVERPRLRHQGQQHGAHADDCRTAGQNDSGTVAVNESSSKGRHHHAAHRPQTHRYGKEAARPSELLGHGDQEDREHSHRRHGPGPETGQVRDGKDHPPVVDGQAVPQGVPSYWNWLSFSPERTVESKPA